MFHSTLLFLLLCIVSDDFPPRENQTWVLQELLDEIIQPILQEESEIWNNSAITVSVHDASGWSWNSVSGEIRPNTPTKASDLFLWGSTTKMVTAIGVMKEVERGKMSLSDKLTDIVDPWLKSTYNGTRLEDFFGPPIYDVTLRLLLSMRSGIPDYDTPELREYQNKDPLYDIDPLDILTFAKDADWACDPGTCGTYSSTNYVLLGLVLVAHHGYASWLDFDQSSVFPDDVRDILKDKVYFPLQGPCSDLEGVDGHRVAYGYASDGSVIYNTSCLQGWTCGNMAATAEGVALLNYYLWGTEKILNQTTKTQMMTYQLLTDYFWWYGLGTMLLGDTTSGTDSFYGHGGATYGFYSNSGYDQQLKFSYVISTNLEVLWPGDNLGEMTNKTFMNIRKAFYNYRYDLPKWYPPAAVPVDSCSSSHDHRRHWAMIGLLLGLNVCTCCGFGYTCWRMKQDDKLRKATNDMLEYQKFNPITERAVDNKEVGGVIIDSNQKAKIHNELVI